MLTCQCLAFYMFSTVKCAGLQEEVILVLHIQFNVLSALICLNCRVICFLHVFTLYGLLLIGDGIILPWTPLYGR